MSIPKFLMILFFLLSSLNSKGQKYFNTSPFQNTPYYTEPQDVLFDSTTNTYLASFASRSYTDTFYLNPTTFLLLYDTTGNILKQAIWDPNIQDTVLKIEMILKYRNENIVIGNMRVHDSNYVFLANTDTTLTINNLRFSPFPHNDSNLVYQIQFDTTNSQFNYLFFSRVNPRFNPFGYMNTPFVFKLSKPTNSFVHLNQIYKTYYSPTLASKTYSNTLAEFSLNDSTFKVAYLLKWDSLNSSGSSQSPIVSSYYLRITNLDTNFIYDPINNFEVWDTVHYPHPYFSLKSAFIPVLVSKSDSEYIFCNQMASISAPLMPNNYFIGLYLVDKFSDTVKLAKQIPAYPGNPSDSISGVHTLSHRKGLTKLDNNHYYLVGSEGAFGEVIFIYSLDSNFNIRWSKFIERDSVSPFLVKSVELNYRGDILIATYAYFDSTIYDYPILVLLDSSGNFPSQTNEILNGLTSVTIYPNPSKNNIRIKSSLNLSNSQVRIYNISGQLVKKVILTNTSQEIAVSDLTQGTYILELSKNSKKMLKCVFLRE